MKKIVIVILATLCGVFSTQKASAQAIANTTESETLVNGALVIQLDCYAYGSWIDPSDDSQTMTV